MEKISSSEVIGQCMKALENEIAFHAGEIARLLLNRKNSPEKTKKVAEHEESRERLTEAYDALGRTQLGDINS